MQGPGFLFPAPFTGITVVFQEVNYVTPPWKSPEHNPLKCLWLPVLFVCPEASSGHCLDWGEAAGGISPLTVRVGVGR